MKKYLLMLVCLFAVVSYTYAKNDVVVVDCGGGNIHNLPSYVDFEDAYDALCG
ncbi:hypothetical protein [Saccharicrinis aurantiacus]|uniref:hypothetical protein n=1 Tax=Saccharicrinis aurantiacus TaxID=1849719 RepID=UPI002493229B|nr:hypothetical protein [Saccharicrinis aurantiacus]